LHVQAPKGLLWRIAMSLRNYLNAVSAAISASNGEQLSFLLMLDCSAIPSGIFPGGAESIPASAIELSSSGRLRDAVGAFFSPTQEATKGWHTVLVSHLVATGAAASGEWEGAFTSNHEALSAFVDILQASSTNWLVRPLHTLVRDTVKAIRSHEAALRTRGVREGCPEKVNSLVTTLRNAFNYTLNHRLPKDQLPASKKWGALQIVNTLFSIFFRADQLRQCKFFIRGVETPMFPPLEQFPKSQVVTYRYYAGVLAAYEDDYKRASTFLSAAFKMCHGGDRYLGNRRKILEVLIPIYMYSQARLPSDGLLERYGLKELYGPIVKAFKTGDIALYNATMESKRDEFIQKGVYLTIERLQMLIYRTLFKKM
jgi:COP9 signalosome complex subunit 12